MVSTPKELFDKISKNLRHEVIIASHISQKIGMDISMEMNANYGLFGNTLQIFVTNIK